MLPEIPPGEAADMNADIEEMEKLISVYLSFARGEGSEQAAPTDISLLLDDVAMAARRSGAVIDCDVPDSLVATLRPEAIRRAVTNLVDNARRHARHIWLVATRTRRTLRIIIDDDGPGIPAAQPRPCCARSRAPIPAAPALAWPSPRTLSAPMAAICCSSTGRAAACAW